MKKLPVLPAVLMIMAMFAVAEYTGEKEVIFPEIAAIALGAWIMEKSPWRSSLLHIWLSPTLAALTGMLMVRFLTYDPLFMITTAFCLVVLQLKLLRSDVLPSVSAAVLAIIARSESWYYPLSVCVMTGTIALGRYILERSGSWPNQGNLPGRTVQDKTAGNGIRPEPAQWSKPLAGVMAVSTIAVASDHLFLVAPPLIVTFLEMSKPGGKLHDKAGKILGLLLFAALSGVLWLELIHTVLHWPVWVSAGVSTLTVFLAYHALRLPFPPAVAIALLPTIVPQESLWSYPWQVFLGSALFILISRVCLVGREQASVMEYTSAE